MNLHVSLLVVKREYLVTNCFVGMTINCAMEFKKEKEKVQNVMF